MEGDPLVCPSCARSYPPSERFCEACGMPLVHAQDPKAQEPVGPRRQTARKIKPQYADGPLVKVARAGSESEADFIAGLLLEEGIPSMTPRSSGFDVAEFDILVPESGAQPAREALTPQSPQTDG